MKAKNALMIFAMIAMAVFFTTCNTGSITDDVIPKDETVSIQYVRQPPIDGFQPDAADIHWFYSSFEGAAGMSRTAEDHFSASASIKTETEILLNIRDMRKATECGGYVRRLVTIDNHTYVYEGSNCGNIKFIKRNDGSIEFK
jgi:hypothetical protein